MNKTSNHLTVAAALVTAWAVLAGAALSFIKGQPWPVLLCTAMLGVAWSVTWSARGRAHADPEALTRQQARHRSTLQALLFAGLLLGTALSAKLVGQIDGLAEYGNALGLRSQGVIMGALVMAFANVIPKQIGSICSLATRRFVGWALFLGGLAYTLAWLLLPLALAGDAAMVALLIGLVGAIGRVIGSLVNRRRS